MFQRSNSNKNSLKKQLNLLYRLEKALYQDNDGSNRLKFNVLGHRYEVPAEILTNHPDTLLGEPKLRAFHYDFFTDEFVFDRDPQAFESILTFYQSDGNSLSKPEWMPAEVFYEELKFFRIKTSILVAFFDQEIAPMIDICVVPKTKFQREFWLLLNYATRDWRSQVMRTIDFLLNLIALWTLTRDYINEPQTSQILYWSEHSSGMAIRPIYLLSHLTWPTVSFILLFLAKHFVSI